MKTMKTIKTPLIFAVALMLAYVVAECPNGCSGQGTCSARDMCNCDKNFYGNDCSLRACPNAYAFIDTPKGDLNMDSSISSTMELTNSQLYPAGTFEFLHPDAVAGEGHWYMECANRGLCDSETGTCTCFAGYEGAACQRTVCPNDCSGHGVCESISELSSKQNGQLSHKDTYHGAQTYTLWDKKSSYGCKCDPWFYGADCSQRRCKVGVDPMYEAVGQEIIETITISIAEGATSGSINAASYFRIKLWDYWGEAYHTSRIAIASTISGTSANIQAALLAIPNGVITDVTCGDSSSMVVASSTAPEQIIGCQFTSNPGSLRLPTVEQVSVTGDVDVKTITLVGSVKRGEEVDYCGTKGSGTIDLTLDSDAITDGPATPASSKATLVKVKDRYLAVFDDSGTNKLAFNWEEATITAADFYYSTQPLTILTETITTWNFGENSFVSSAATSLSAGDLVFTANQFFTVVSRITNTVTVDRPYHAASIASGTTAIYYWAANDVPTSGVFTYVSECSGRGICATESGVCQCFKGYTNDNCDTQNILAF